MLLNFVFVLCCFVVFVKQTKNKTNKNLYFVFVLFHVVVFGFVKQKQRKQIQKQMFAACCVFCLFSCVFFTD